jgi:hypothetical protein
MCQSTIVYDLSESAQVLYVIPVSSILGWLPHIPVGKAGSSWEDTVRVAERIERLQQRCRWLYVNRWDMMEINQQKPPKSFSCAEYAEYAEIAAEYAEYAEYAIYINSA